jgi:hypothetical protein
VTASGHITIEGIEALRVYCNLKEIKTLIEQFQQ